MIAQFLKQLTTSNLEALLTSNLYDEVGFYPAFLGDISKCKQELIIESPFATNKRVSLLLPFFERLKQRGVRIAINTRDPEEHEGFMGYEARQSLAKLQSIGIQVIYTKDLHRKLSIIDRSVIWEGSLNILSQCASKEIMRRTESASLAWQMARFINIDALLNRRRKSNV